MVIAPIIYIAIFRYTYVHFPERVRIWLDAKTQKTNQKKREAGFSQKCSHFELYHPPLSMKRNESINNLFQYRARVKQDRKVSCLNQQSLKNRRHMNIISIKEYTRNITLKDKSFFSISPIKVFFILGIYSVWVRYLGWGNFHISNVLITFTFDAVWLHILLVQHDQLHAWVCLLGFDFKFQWRFHYINIYTNQISRDPHHLLHRNRRK